MDKVDILIQHLRMFGDWWVCLAMLDELRI